MPSSKASRFFYSLVAKFMFAWSFTSVKKTTKRVANNIATGRFVAIKNFAPCGTRTGTFFFPGSDAAHYTTGAVSPHVTCPRGLSVHAHHIGISWQLILAWKRSS